MRATITLVPAETPNVRNVMSFYAETSFDSTGNSDFDLVAGESQKVVQFTVPIAGTVLAVGGHIHDYGTRFVVVRGGTAEMRAGDLNPRHVVIEFASFAVAKACYDSPEYQAALKVRDRASVADMVLVEGYDG